MLIKLFIIFILLTIIFLLGDAAFQLTRKKQKPKALAKVLTWRVSLSVFLFLFLLFCFYMGWITPRA